MFIFFSISSKPFRLLGIYQQERFLKVAKEVGVKVSSDRATKLTAKINEKVVELKTFIASQDVFDSTHERAVRLTEEVNMLVSDLVAENTNSLLYRCFVRFT
jgi:hypothetical protein